eukprot:3024521-Alexandrium_andersonii.AAC.1
MSGTSSGASAGDTAARRRAPASSSDKPATGVGGVSGRHGNPATVAAQMPTESGLCRHVAPSAVASGSPVFSMAVGGSSSMGEGSSGW